MILAANHAAIAPDEKLKATLAKLEVWFGALYPINKDRAGPALGRYAEDSYYGGGAWYAATLAAAEFCYRAGDLGRGDAYLETVRAFTPDSGDLSDNSTAPPGYRLRPGIWPGAMPRFLRLWLRACGQRIKASAQSPTIARNEDLAIGWRRPKCTFVDFWKD